MKAPRLAEYARSVAEDARRRSPSLAGLDRLAEILPPRRMAHWPWRVERCGADAGTAVPARSMKRCRGGAGTPGRAGGLGSDGAPSAPTGPKQKDLAGLKILPTAATGATPRAATKHPFV